MSIVLLAAVLAVTAVSVAERIEVELTDATVAEVPSSPDPVVAPSNALASDALATADAPPLASAVLPSGAMALTLSDGAATITTGVKSTAIELATTAIGDLDLDDLADDVVIAQTDGEVSYDWGDVTEWYRTVPEGIEHGYTIDAPLSDADELTVKVAVADGTPTLVDADAVTITREGGSIVWYRGLVGFDANGTDLPAEMAVVDGAIELWVDTSGAVYPITIDPVISDANSTRPIVDATQLTVAADTARLAGVTAGPDIPPSSCLPGSVMTGVTVYPRVDQNNQLRVMVPRCRELVVTGETLSFAGPAMDAPDFGTRNLSFPVLGPQTRECADGSAMTGLVAQVGSTIDRVAIRCVPLLGPDAVGSPTSQSDFYGGGSVDVALRDPVDCANSFATGLQGTGGDDITAVGLRCESIGGRFGFAVDVDGNRMVVSAPFAPLTDDSAGEVRVYDRAGADSPWVHSATLTRPALVAGSRFGDSLSLRGNLIAVGESDRLGDEADAGRVWIYSFDGFAWEQLGDGSALQQPVPTMGDRFGADIEWISDTTLAIGAPGAVADRGNVFIAEYDSMDGTWSYSDLVTVLAGFGAAPETDDEFGYAIGYDDSTDGIGALIVGAPGFDQSFPSDMDGGAVYRFFGGGPTFIWNGSAAYLPGRRVGTSVAVSGNRHVVGGYGSGSFEVNAYEYTSTWTDIGGRFVAGDAPGANDGQVNDYLALDDEFLAVGRGGSGGGVSVYTVGGTWPSGTALDVEPTGREAGDRIGWSLALENSQLTVGAPGDDGATNQLFDSGAVYTVGLSSTATFINPVEFAPWDDPANWDLGVVPGAGDTAIVPFGTYPELGDGVVSTVETLIVGGQLRIRGDLRVDGASTVEELATVDLQSTGQFEPAAVLMLDGELSNGGTVIIDGPTSIPGSGRFINDGELLKTGAGTLTLGPAVVWTARASSQLHVSSGDVEILGELFDDNVGSGISDDVTAGTFSVAAGTSLTFDGDLIVGPGTRFVTEINGDDSSTENYGRIIADRLGFDRIVPNPGSGLVGFEANVSIDVDASDIYPIITCSADCAPDIGEGGDVVLSVEFDQLALNGLTPVQTRLAIDLRTVANKVIAPDSSVRLGNDLSIDGDWGVAARQGGIDVLERDTATDDWEIAQSITNTGVAGVGRSVAIEDDLIAVVGSVGGFDLQLYRRPDPSSPFAAAEFFGLGGPLSFVGDVAVHDGVVFVTNTAPNGLMIWEPGVSTSFVGSTVLDVFESQSVAVGGDLATGQGYVAVGVSDDSAVHVFEQTATTPITFGDIPVQTITGPVGTGFGASVAVSEDRLVVGAPLDGIPVPGAGAAWVYERPSPGELFAGDPVKLQASDAEVSDTLGDDVAIDGDVIVVGAPIAQKFAFPLRDGAAYVFQHNGAAWVETDALRALDGYSEEGFGDAVAVSGNRVLIGTPNDANDYGADAGAVYFYEPTVIDENPTLTLEISPSDPTPAVGVGTIALSDLPATVLQGYGGTTSDYATSDLKTLDLRADLGAPNSGTTPVAAVTLDELGLDSAPITRRLLNTILLPEIPIEGGWSRALRPNTTELLVEQTISLLDVYQESAPGGRYPGATERIELGDLGLQASNLGSISTFAALLAGAPVDAASVPSRHCECTGLLVWSGGRSGPRLPRRLRRRPLHRRGRGEPHPAGAELRRYRHRTGGSARDPAGAPECRWQRHGRRSDRHADRRSAPRFVEPRGRAVGIAAVGSLEEPAVVRARDTPDPRRVREHHARGARRSDAARRAQSRRPRPRWHSAVDGQPCRAGHHSISTIAPTRPCRTTSGCNLRSAPVSCSLRRHRCLPP